MEKSKINDGKDDEQSPCNIGSTITTAVPGVSGVRVDEKHKANIAQPDARPDPSIKKPRLLQPQIGNYGVTTDQKVKKQLDEQVARFFYACNIPFAVAEQNEFKQLISQLRPGYKPPTRRASGTTLLDTVYESVTDATAKDLQNRDVT